MTELDPKKFLRSLFDAAIASAQPARVLAQHLPEKPKGRCIVVGAGKASAAMAAALEAAWPDVAMSGVVVTRYDHAVPTRHIKIIEASHPVPDDNSLFAGREILNTVSNLGADDLVIALISGGGSALLVAPVEGVALADKQALNKALLASGAAIGEMNVVRKHLSRIKGGKLALAAAPARVVTLVISDVPGDDPSIIASGPTVFDGTTPGDALAILKRYSMNVGDNIIRSLNGAATTMVFTSDVRMIASPIMALRAAAEVARKLGVTPVILGDALEGEASDVGKVFAGMALSCKVNNAPSQSPCVLLSGGECTVSIRNGKAGRGGRNTEFLLSAAIALKGEQNIWGLAGDTDGIDGTEDAAGAMIAPDTLSRARDAGLDPRAFLADHDSYALFQRLDDLIITGPTMTNVNDFRALLVA